MLQQTLLSSDHVDQELAELRTNFQRAVPVLANLETIQQNFKGYQAIYQRAKEFLQQADTLLIETEKRGQSIISDLNQQKTALHDLKQSLIKSNDSYWKEQQASFAQLQKRIEAALTEFNQEKISIQDLRQSLLHSNELQWKDFQNAFLKAQNDLLVANNSTRIDLTELVRSARTDFNNQWQNAQSHLDHLNKVSAGHAQEIDQNKQLFNQICATQQNQIQQSEYLLNELKTNLGSIETQFSNYEKVTNQAIQSLISTVQVTAAEQQKQRHQLVQRIRLVATVAFFALFTILILAGYIYIQSVNTLGSLN